MKLRLKSLIKSNSPEFDFFQSSQIIVQVGSNLCIKQLQQRQYQFIPLYKNLQTLKAFKTSPGAKAIFTLQLNQNHIEACSYNIKGQRKVVKFNDQGALFPIQQIQKYGLLCDQFDSTLVYGYVTTKTDSCIFLINFQKSKVVYNGYIAGAQELIANHKETYTLSACGKGFIKILRATSGHSGHWDIQEKNIKKLMYEHFYHHLWITSQRYLGITHSNAFFVDVETHQIIQEFDFNGQKINHAIEIPNGLIFIVNGNRVVLYVYNSQDDKYIFQTFKEVKSRQNKPIKKAVLNDQREIILMRTEDLDFFSWKIDSISNPQLEDRIKIDQVQNIHAPYQDGNISVSSGKNYSLILERNYASFWDIQKNAAIIKTNFSSYQSDKQKTLYSGAISPDGHSFILAFPDRVKFFRILLSSFKFFAQFHLKKCQIISYSHGGQLVVCQSGRSPNSVITIINTLRLRQVFSRKINSDIQQIVWNQLDDQFYLSTTKNQILCFSVPDKQKAWQLKFTQHINFLRYDYKINKLLASTSNSIYVIMNAEEYQKLQPKIPDFNYVFPVDSSYLLTSHTGSIYWSSTIQGSILQQIKLFANQDFNLIYRKENLIAYTNLGAAYLLDCNKSLDKKNQNEAQIVLVQKDQITKFFDKVKVLENNFETLQNTSQMRIDKQIEKYDTALSENKKKFLEQIEFLQKKLSFLQSQKVKQQKDHTKVFQQLQDGQVKNVSQLEKIYDRKLKIQKQKYLSLQQQSLQDKLNFQKKFKELENKYHNDIDKIRKQYQKRIQKQCGKIEQVKQQQLNQKKKMQTRIISLEQQSQQVLYYLQKQKDQKITNLIQKMNRLERDYDTSMVNRHNLKSQMDQMQVQYQKALKQVQKSHQKVLQYMNRAKLLEEQVKRKDKMIQQRNNLIEHQGQQIAGLQKAKYVLGFRTTQIRKQFQPKEALIEKLKQALFKQDQQFKQKTQKIFDLQQKLEKVQKVNEYTKKDLNHYKFQLKAKQKVHDQLCAQIFNVANFIDQKEWVNELVKIYRKFIKQEKYSNVNGKKTDKTSQQINRHLMHVQQSLLHVSTGNQKALKGTKIQVKRKMMQNADLVFDLNNMRKKQNQLQNQLKQRNTEIARLKRQISQHTKSTRNCNTANTGVTRRINASRQQKTIMDAQTSFDINLRRASDYLIPEKSRRSNRILSAHKTMVWREDPKKQKTKIITDLARQLQSAKNTIKRQDRMIQQLNQRLLGLPQDAFI